MTILAVYDLDVWCLYPPVRTVMTKAQSGIKISNAAACYYS